MTKWRVNLISALVLAAVVAEAHFQNRQLYIIGGAGYMLCLVFGAVLVGRIPRRLRSRRSQIVCWIVGWPMFTINLALMAASFREMLILNAPSWILIIAFFWVLTYLTWTIFIDPNTGFGGWWRGDSGPDEPQPFPHRPPSARKPLPEEASLSWRKKYTAKKIAALN
jgi:hypothetical protein